MVAPSFVTVISPSGEMRILSRPGRADEKEKEGSGRADARTPGPEGCADDVCHSTCSKNVRLFVH